MSSRLRATGNQGAPSDRRGRVAPVLAGLVALVLLLGPADEVAAQDGSTEPSVPQLIVPGEPSVTTVPADATPGTTVPEVEVSSTDDGLAASTKVWIIIGGLVGVALLVLLLTILYWRRTKPSAVAARRAARADEGSDDEVPAGEDPAAASAVAAAPAEAAAPAAAPQASPVPAPAGEEPVDDTPRPVGDTPPVDPRRSVFAPPPEDDPPSV